MKKFKVVRVTPGNVNGGFVVTIEHEVKTTVFGKTHTTRDRYCLKMDEAPTVGTEQELDLAQWVVTERKSEVIMKDQQGNAVPNENGEEQMITITTKWLNWKAA